MGDAGWKSPEELHHIYISVSKIRDKAVSFRGGTADSFLLKDPNLYPKQGGKEGEFSLEGQTAPKNPT